MSERLDLLAARVRDAIPLTRHLHFSYREFDGQSLVVSAPLAPNSNDKGTFFAGSQSALLTLAGWSLTTLLAETGDQRVDVVAVESSLRYLHPLNEDMVIRAWPEQDDGASALRARLIRRGKAPLRILAQAVSTDGQVICQYQGLYLARILDNDP
ncbi:hypothetical protein A11A3_05671 [Alcanivorax hongdengensis A-11-3]|uniref:Thioesterase putative domain-containing protein n=1 Tax=Alcanivorax hongdengensis A-11-3 TaxID=1177179 RepID=L0WFL1_9GAMM|nr:YiiD C-terminal domain-containing protein [Alcanivorax hongdengensis]EKF74917.1 hypothetical protein A11A3_05671 [Alcanivorax hongdengensis A-11-3]